MTMLAAVSVPGGIVLSADSCITCEKKSSIKTEKTTKQGEKIFVVSDRFAFMTYGDGDVFYNFEMQYAHELSEYGEIRRMDMGGGNFIESRYPNLSLEGFMDHMVISRKPYADYLTPRDKRCKDYRTGIVLAGFDNGIPKLYTFIKGANTVAYDCEEYMYNIPGNSKSAYFTKATKKYPQEELKYYRYEGCFGICFATTQYISRSTSYERDFSKMTLNDAVLYSEQLIKDTIERMNQNGDELSVNYPIDTVIIQRNQVTWRRNSKDTDPKQPK